VLIVSHGFSFFWNYIGRGEFRRVSPDRLMGQPYARIVVLHIAIIFSGFLLILFRSPIVGLLLLIILKICLDVSSHLREHARLGPSV
jgi:hypothetical protein